MLIRQGYVFESKAGRREYVVKVRFPDKATQLSNPGCECGSEMKKPYSKPALRVEQRAQDIRFVRKHQPSHF